MGINGLLPMLKSIHKSCNLKKFEGKTLAVDAYGWLHRGTVACAMELALGKPTRKYVDFSMHRVRMLQHFGVIPFLIFDGDYLPSKAATEAERAKRRQESRKAGQALLSAGKVSQACLEFQKAVDVTPEMARQLIDELKKTGIQYIVAPYEADAQMVYLERKGIIDGIISEDSDLLVFGAKCLLTKLDQYGNCIEINRADFCACREMNLAGWSDVEFRCMAILSGCDYLNSITNMGLKTAYRMVRKHKTIDKVIRMLQFDGKFFVPKGYLEAFNQAELTFLHQRVFCPQKLTLVFHTEPDHPIDEERMPFIGAYVRPEIAQAVARGDLNPITKLPIIPKSRVKIAVQTQQSVNSRAQPPPSASTNEFKKGKPIGTFFKQRRTPLAELDVNCFTHSPSQQEALSRNTGPWLGSPAARPYINSAVAHSGLPQLPRSAPPIARSNVADSRIRIMTISEPRPLKRPRLCADIDTEKSPNRGQVAEHGRSRFFAWTTPDESPSVGRSGCGSKSKEGDINIFSDDSLNEVMCNLPDVDGFGNGAKIAVFETETPEKSGASSSQTSVKGSTRADDSVISQEFVPNLTPTPSPDTPLPPAIAKLKGAFSFTLSKNSTAKPNLVLQALSKTTTSAPNRPSRIPLAAKSNVSVQSIHSTTKTASLTPLQRLGANATSRAKLPMTPPMTPLGTVACQNSSSQPRRSLLSRGSVPFPEVTQESQAKETEPASIPLPRPDETEELLLSTDMQEGSEDMIVHDSEEEDCLSPTADERVPRVNLGRFVYDG